MSHKNDGCLLARTAHCQLIFPTFSMRIQCFERLEIFEVKGGRIGSREIRTRKKMRKKRERERERETDRQTDRETDTGRDRG